MMSSDSIIDLFRPHRLHCATLYHLPLGRRVIGTRSFHSCSHCLVLPLLICRFDLSSLLFHRRSLRRLSWVCASGLVRVRVLPLFFLLFLLLSLLSCWWVDYRSPKVSLLLSPPLFLLDLKGVSLSCRPLCLATLFTPSVSASLPLLCPLFLLLLLLLCLLQLLFSSSASLASSQPVVPSVSLSLPSRVAMVVGRGGGGVFQERQRFWLPMQRWGVVACFRSGGDIFCSVELSGREESDTRVCSAAMGAFLAGVITYWHFFPEFYLWSLNPSHWVLVPRFWWRTVEGISGILFVLYDCGSLGLRLFAGRLWIRRISVASSLSFRCGTTFIVWMLCLFLMRLFHPTLSFLVYCIGRSLLRDISSYH